MARKYLAFDIETAKITPDGDDIQNHRPLGISCWAVALLDDGGEIVARSYCGTDSEGNNTQQMNQMECMALVRMLRGRTEMGYTLLTHNGCSFDMDILAEESGMHAECAELAMNSIDTCLQIHCIKGFPVGLEAIARGMGLQGKIEGMSGALAPQLWADGEYDKVLEYVAQDARSTLEVALEIERRRGLTWISKTGRRNSLPIERWLTVKECLALPLPDTSWMSDPLPRSKFTGWMDASTTINATA